MEKKIEGEKFTVQGRDTLVPALRGSEKAGTLASSSSDRSATEGRKKEKGVGMIPNIQVDIAPEEEEVFTTPSGSPKLQQPRVLNTLKVKSCTVKKSSSNQNILDNVKKPWPNQKCSSVPDLSVERLRRCSYRSDAASCDPSGITESCIESFTKFRNEIRAERVKEVKYLEKILDEIEKMEKVCKPNTSQTFKDGLIKMKDYLHEIHAIRVEVEELEEVYDKRRDLDEWDRVCRQKDKKLRQDKTQADILKKAGVWLKESLVGETSKKRNRNEVSPEKANSNKRQAGQKVERWLESIPIAATEANQENQEQILQQEKKKETEGKKKKVKKKPRPRQSESTRVLVRVAQGETYANVLRKIRKEVDPEASNTKVLAVNTTAKGDILIKIAKESDRTTFVAAIDKVVGVQGKVEEEKKNCVTLEIRDLDDLTQEDEVKEAINGILGPESKPKFKLLNVSRRGFKLAIVFVNNEEAKKLIEVERVRIGLTYCQIRKRIIVPRCYNCLGYGHYSKDCKKEKKIEPCYKCGISGHKKADCTAEMCCFLCKETPGWKTGHIAGSGTCTVFRLALNKEKEKLKDTRRIKH